MSTAKGLPAAKASVIQPSYVFRGHASPVQVLTFLRENSCLASADADGYIVVWSTATRRPFAVWQAHDASVLGIKPWGDERLITQGRDSRLLVWDLTSIYDPTSGFSTVLPAEILAERRKQPWLLYTLEVTTLNFCSFASCLHKPTRTDTIDEELPEYLLIAVSGCNDSEIEMYQLPDQEKKGVITAPQDNNGKAAGMVMALHMFYDDADVLTILAAYENSQTCVFKRVAEAMSWQQTYSSKPHTQPILSLDSSPTLDSYFTSGADGILVKHPLKAHIKGREVQTRHSGQQGLRVRSDGLIFATAGWDHKGRVYSVKTMKELAVLQWHKESCYSIAFATIAEKDVAIASEAVTATSQTVAQTREAKVRNTHWLALGSKDGKISLWDIY